VGRLGALGVDAALQFLSRSRLIFGAPSSINRVTSLWLMASPLAARSMTSSRNSSGVEGRASAIKA